MKFNFKENTVKTNVNYGELTISTDDMYGFRPFQLMVASIVSCSGSVFKKILKKQRIEIEDLTIHAEVERNPEDANRIEKMNIVFHIKGSNLNLGKLNKNLEIARKNCAMIRSVEDSIKIEETIEISEA